jgi:hypothetical protein
MRERAVRVLEELFAAFMEDVARLPDEHRHHVGWHDQAGGTQGRGPDERVDLLGSRRRQRSVETGPEIVEHPTS